MYIHNSIRGVPIYKFWLLPIYVFTYVNITYFKFTLRICTLHVITKMTFLFKLIKYVFYAKIYVHKKIYVRKNIRMLAIYVRTILQNPRQLYLWTK